MPSSNDPRRNLPPGSPVTSYQVTAGVAALRKSPELDAEMVTQALHGEVVDLASEENGFALVQLVRDSYVGWTNMDALSAPVLDTTHKVVALRTYVFSEPDLKSAPRYLLSMNAEIVAEDTEGRFTKCARAGWVTTDHLVPLQMVQSDPADVAQSFIGTPYLWGGKESLGLDCTGLTQAAFGACGISLPRDSDMQFEESGTAIENWTEPGALKRGDLVFWRGHVGIMVNEHEIIHANAYHMAVAREPLKQAVERIAAYYDRPIGAKRILA